MCQGSEGLGGLSAAPKTWVRAAAPYPNDRGLGGAQRQRGRAPSGTRSPKSPWLCPVLGGEGRRVGRQGGTWGRELSLGVKAAAAGAA